MVDIAIIGGGAIGTSLLFHLAKNGCTDAVLFEKDQLGSGSTSKAAGGVRNTFSLPLNIEMGNFNIEYFANFEENTGVDVEFRQSGYMYLFHSEESERTWRKRKELYDRYGARADIVSAARAAEIFSLLDTDQFEGALFAPDCGHVDPHLVTQAFGSAAVDLGATVRTKTTVEDVRTSNGAVESVVTDDEEIEVEYVINAAGPWAPRVGEMVGIEVPIELMARRIAITSPIDERDSPLIIDNEIGCYFRAEQNGSMLICDMTQDTHDIEDPGEIQAGSIGYNYYLGMFETVEPLVPQVTELDIINGWAGIQSHTPDGNAILGPTRVDGFLLACGFSGHGVQQSPGVGTALAEFICQGHTDLFDISRLSLDRFADDALLVEGIVD